MLYKVLLTTVLIDKQWEGFGRLRMRHIPGKYGDALVPFVCGTVRLGSVVQTDGWVGYNQMQKKDYFH